jgi:riboflavin biosynthesis pyrimidine reductase
VSDAPGAQRIDARLRALYGSVPGEVGVLHVAAVWRAPGGGLHVLRIGPDTPTSDTDAFALSLARSRADAIVTTGRILREEPRVTHEVLDIPERIDLGAWRRLRLGRHEPPRSAVLTRGLDLDLDHPLFCAGPRPWILTTPDAAARLAAAAVARGIEPLGLDPLDLRHALRALAQRGMRCISIEAGPETALDLYREPLAIDELMLSVYEGPLPAPLVGGAFLEPRRLEALLPHASAPQRVGAWSFERRTRVRC